MLFPFYVVLAFSRYRISYKSSNFLNQAQYHQIESLTLHKNSFVRHKTSPSNKHHEAHIFRYLFWKSRLIFGLSSFTRKFRNVSGMTEGWCHLTSWPETMRVSLHHLIHVTWLLLLLLLLLLLTRNRGVKRNHLSHPRICMVPRTTLIQKDQTDLRSSLPTCQELVSSGKPNW